MPWHSPQQPFGGHHCKRLHVTLLRMGASVRRQTTSLAVKTIAAVALIGLTYWFLGPYLAAAVALPIVAFTVRRAVLSLRS